MSQAITIDELQCPRAEEAVHRVMAHAAARQAMTLRRKYVRSLDNKMMVEIAPDRFVSFEWAKKQGLI